MSLNYLCFGSYWRNLTSPMTHWHRGTAIQIDNMKDHPDMQVVAGKLGTDMVVLTMAARITQSIFTLVRNLLQRRPLSWKIIPGDWRSKAFQAVLWMCWNVVDILLAVEVTNMLVYRSLSKQSTHCHTEQSMNAVCIKCHLGCKAELNRENLDPEKELSHLSMENLVENTYMEDIWDHRVFSDMDIVMSKEALLPSCKNPLILSMICVPSEDGESLSPSEESDLSEFESDSESDHVPPCEESSLSESESEDAEPGRDSSLEDTSVDSGMQESWTPKSKEDIDDSEEESEWSDEDDDSWDEESDADQSRDEDLWVSFCRTDDPYNPLSFAMPTRSTKNQEKNKVLHASSEKHQISVSSRPIAQHGERQDLKCTMWPQAKKPVLSCFKSSHKYTRQKDESESLEELMQSGSPGVKKVHFSSNVTVHHMFTWSYAYRMARKGPWEEYARDRSRFQKRIAETEAAIGFCLEPRHREKIWAASHFKES